MITVVTLFEKFHTYLVELQKTLTHFGIKSFFATNVVNKTECDKNSIQTMYYNNLESNKNDLISHLSNNKCFIILNFTNTEDFGAQFLNIKFNSTTPENDILYFNLPCNMVSCNNIERLIIKLNSTDFNENQTLIDFIYNNNSMNIGFQTENSIIIQNGAFGDTQRIPTYIYTPPSRFKSSYKIYPVCNWQSSQDLYNNWIKFQPLKLKNKIEFTLNKQEADYYMVINSTNEQLEPNKILYFAMEPHVEKSPSFGPYVNYLKSLPTNVSPSFMGLHNISINNTEWHLSPSINEFSNYKIEKKFDRALSVVVSTKNFDEGHILRLNFIKRLDDLSKEGKLPFELHVYGSKTDFYNYKGTLPPGIKDNGMFPYKYHLNAENNSIKNYITEKFTDAIMAECMLFYWGCPNVDDYYPSNCYQRLSLRPENFDSDLQCIIDSMNNDEYAKRLNIIQQTKKTIIDHFNLFRRLKTVIQLTDVIVFCLLTNEEKQFIQKYTEILKQQSFKNVLFVEKHQVNSQTIKSFLLEPLKLNKDFIVVRDLSMLENLHQIVSTKLMKSINPDIKFIHLDDEKDISISSFYMKLDLCETIV